MLEVVQLPRRKGVWSKVRSFAAHIRHPKGDTCLGCGFLSFGTEELILFNRTLLAVKGVAGLPDDVHLSHICCFRSLWVPPPDDGHEVLLEVVKRRRPCEGFIKYRPGYSPLDHRGLLEKKQDRRRDLVIGICAAVGGAALTLLAAWIRKHFGF
ncbi:MAG: hypothetical protein WAN65_04870 [Candidatus Sulfotelmatobacter sp.]